MSRCAIGTADVRRMCPRHCSDKPSESAVRAPSGLDYEQHLDVCEPVDMSVSIFSMLRCVCGSGRVCSKCPGMAWKRLLMTRKDMLWMECRLFKALLCPSEFEDDSGARLESYAWGARSALALWLVMTRLVASLVIPGASLYAPVSHKDAKKLVTVKLIAALKRLIVKHVLWEKKPGQRHKEFVRRALNTCAPIRKGSRLDDCGIVDVGFEYVYELVGCLRGLPSPVTVLRRGDVRCMSSAPYCSCYSPGCVHETSRVEYASEILGATGSEIPVLSDASMTFVVAGIVEAHVRTLVLSLFDYVYSIVSSVSASPPERIASVLPWMFSADSSRLLPLDGIDAVLGIDPCLPHVRTGRGEHPAYAALSLWMGWEREVRCSYPQPVDDFYFSYDRVSALEAETRASFPSCSRGYSEPPPTPLPGVAQQRRAASDPVSSLAHKTSKSVALAGPMADIEDMFLAPCLQYVLESARGRDITGVSPDLPGRVTNRPPRYQERYQLFAVLKKVAKPGNISGVMRNWVGMTADRVKKYTDQAKGVVMSLNAGCYGCRRVSSTTGVDGSCVMRIGDKARRTAVIAQLYPWMPNPERFDCKSIMRSAFGDKEAPGPSPDTVSHLVNAMYTRRGSVPRADASDLLVGRPMPARVHQLKRHVREVVSSRPPASPVSIEEPKSSIASGVLQEALKRLKMKPP